MSSWLTGFLANQTFNSPTELLNSALAHYRNILEPILPELDIVAADMTGIEEGMRYGDVHLYVYRSVMKSIRAKLRYSNKEGLLSTPGSFSNLIASFDEDYIADDVWCYRPLIVSMRASALRLDRFIDDPSLLDYFSNKLYSEIPLFPIYSTILSDRTMIDHLWLSKKFQWFSTFGDDLSYRTFFFDKPTVYESMRNWRLQAGTTFTSGLSSYANLLDAFMATLINRIDVPLSYSQTKQGYVDNLSILDNRVDYEVDQNILALFFDMNRHIPLVTAQTVLEA